MSDFFTALNVSSAGLSVQRTRINITSSNLANVETTRTPEGGPYRKRTAIVAAIPVSESFGSVMGHEINDKISMAQVTHVERDDAAPQLVYKPGHPDANENGMVAMPNVNAVEEMVDMLSASRGYEANVSAIRAIKAMAQTALEIGE